MMPLPPFVNTTQRLLKLSLSSVTDNTCHPRRDASRNARIFAFKVKPNRTMTIPQPDSKILPTPDWGTLNEINFLIAHRMADVLNAGLAALTVADLPEESGNPPGWWRERAKSKVEQALDITMAWSWLIQYKTGSPLPEKTVHPFRLQHLLDWLTTSLRLVPGLRTNPNTFIQGNQQTLQEALLLLHSVAASQGAAVRISLDYLPQHIQFRVRFMRQRSLPKPPQSLDELLYKPNGHWRYQITAFELQSARDFLKMNNIDLRLEDTGRLGELLFNIPRIGKRSTIVALNPLSSYTQTSLHDTTQTSRFRGWHLPAPVHRASLSVLVTPPQTLSIAEIPVMPVRPGGWHQPTTVEQV